MSKMKTFILNKGHAQHRQNGNLYSEGDAINTCLDLVRMFPRKFSLAPQGINDERWPSDVVDVHVNGSYAVTVNFNGSTFRVVGPDGKPVAGFASVSRQVAFAKYRELIGKDAPKADKPKNDPPKSKKDDEDEDEDDEPKSKKSKKDDENDGEGDGDDGDGEGDGDEDEDDEPKSKKSKKSKKDDDEDEDEDEDDEPKSKKSKKSKK